MKVNKIKRKKFPASDVKVTYHYVESEDGKRRVKEVYKMICDAVLEERVRKLKEKE